MAQYLSKKGTGKRTKPASSKKSGSKPRLKRSGRDTKSESLAAAAYEVQADDIVFEEEATRIGTGFHGLVICLYGPPKIGKTTTVANIPGVYLLPTEPGYHVHKVRKTKISNWATFINFIKYMEDSPGKLESIDMFAIDTTDNLSKFCMQFVCGREGIAHPSDSEWGKGWEAYKDEFTYWILRLAALGKGIIFVSHEQERESISRSMKITKTSPSLPNTVYKIVNNMADCILYMGFLRKKSKKYPRLVPGVSRCIFSRPQETLEAGDRTHLLPDMIPFKTEKELVTKILGVFEEE